MARVLIAGAYNTLGRIAAVRKREVASLTHFKAAVDGVSGDERLACQARAVSEIARLNLVDQAGRMIKLQERPRHDVVIGANPGHVPDRPGPPPAVALRDDLLDLNGGRNTAQGWGGHRGGQRSGWGERGGG